MPFNLQTLKAKCDERITEIFLVIYFLFLPLKPEFSIIAFIMTIAYFLITNKFKKSFDTWKSLPGMKIMFGFYVLHVIGMLYTTNMDYGLRDLQTKLSFFLFPIVLSGIGLTAVTFEKIKKATIISAVLSMLILLIISFSQYLKSHDSTAFFYTHLSHGKHVTYLAIFMNLALLFVIEKIYSGKQRNPSFIFLLAFAFLFAGILLLSARTSTIVAILTISIFPFFIPSRKNNLRVSWIVHGCCLLFSLFSFLGYLHLFNRFNQVEEAIAIRENQTDSKVVQNESPNSTNIRINIWKNTIQLISRYPLLGVGTGDIKEELVKVYAENGYEYGVKEKPSPHNQFLHTTVILGVFGFIALSLLFFFPLATSFRSKEWLFFFFLLIVFLNSMTESILEREAGILFFTPFLSCFYLLGQGKRKFKMKPEFNIH